MEKVYPIIKGFISSQLFLPIVGLLMGGIMVLIAKKGKLLSDKRAVIYILLSCIVLGVFGVLGFLQVNFMPWGYIGLQCIYLFLGYLNFDLLKTYVKNLQGAAFWKIFIVLILQIFISAAIFSFIFNIGNNFTYGIWASTSLLTLLIIPLFKQTFVSYLRIPMEIYKIKTYEAIEKEIPMVPIDNDTLLVYEIEIYKNPQDEKPIRLKAKSTQNMVFEDWFELILLDYNQQKTASPVEYFDEKDPYGWIFYTKPSFFSPRKYIDGALSFKENKLLEKHLIIARRVRGTKKKETEEIS